MAFEWSAASGFCEVEFDVHLTSDGEPVVFHDLRLHQAAEAEGVIGEKRLADLTATPLRGGGGAIPSLDQVLTRLRDSSIRLRIELKTDVAQKPYEGMQARLIAAIDKHGLRDRCVLSSFSPAALDGLVEQGFSIALWYAREQKPWQPDLNQWLPELKEMGFRDIAVQFKELTAERMAALREAGFNVGVWTVNGPARLDYWMRQPIDFVVSDQPDVAATFRAAQLKSGATT